MRGRLNRRSAAFAMLLSLGTLCGLTAGTPAFAQGADLLDPAEPTIDAPAGGQGLPPGEVRPGLPRGADDAPDPSLELPAIPAPSETGLEAGLAVHVGGFLVEGSTVFSPAEIADTLRPWTGRTLESEELFEARDAITRLYVENGYATSGALIPDQEVKAGVVRLRVIEGRIEDIRVEGHERFRAGYFRTRLAHAAKAPVRIESIERALRILQRDRWLERVDAELLPGDQMGVSRLVLTVVERPAWQLAAEASNDRSPAIGSAGGAFEARVPNLTGWGDEWLFRVQGTAGLTDFEGRFEIPITPWDTRLRLRARATRTELQESPFDDLDIRSRSSTYGVSLVQPLYRSETDDLFIDLGGEWRQTKTTVLGEAFCFELTTEDCSRPRVAALRAGLQWTRATQSDVIAARSLFSVGIDALRATTGGAKSAPDAEFFAWLGQLQWAHVYSGAIRGAQSLFRADIQLSDDPLLSMEQFAVGGRNTVRGYRTNQLVRDSGVILSAELRVPLVQDALDQPVLQFVPFMDWGHAWNHGDAGNSERETLWSLGAGLQAMIRSGVLGEIYWGGRISDVPRRRNFLQDNGFHMRIRIDAPALP